MDAFIFHKGEYIVKEPAGLLASVTQIRISHPPISPAAGGKISLFVYMALHCQADLLEMVDALRVAGRFAGRLDGRQEQGDQDPDNRDDYQ